MGLKNQEKRFNAVSSAQGHQGEDTPTQEGKVLTLLRQVICGSEWALEVPPTRLLGQDTCTSRSLDCPCGEICACRVYWVPCTTVLCCAGHAAVGA
jgi:hypothetical protein